LVRPDEVDRYIKSEMAKRSKVVKKADIGVPE
jgi:hypothetical protein